MFLAMPGKGSQYAGAFFDADGDRPLGERSYTLHLPADVPAANYWSLVVYDAETRCLLDNGDGFASIASNQNLTLNDDGSADLHFGPQPPPTAGATGSKPSPDAAGSAPCAFTAPPRHSSTAPGHPARDPAKSFMRSEAALASAADRGRGGGWQRRC